MLIVNDNSQIEIQPITNLIWDKVVVPVSSTNYTPTANTKVYLPLNGDIADYSGNNWATTSDGPVSSSTQTIFGQDTYYFDAGSSTNVLQITGQPITTTGNWTNSLWYYSGSNGGVLICNGYGWVGGGNGIQIYDYGTSYTGLYPAKFWMANPFITEISQPGWHNLIMTADSGNVYWYIDGVLGYTKDALPYQMDRCLTLGAESMSSDFPWTASTAKWSGYISEWIVEDKVWTQTDVTNYCSSRLPS